MPTPPWTVTSKKDNKRLSDSAPRTQRRINNDQDEQQGSKKKKQQTLTQASWLSSQYINPEEDADLRSIRLEGARPPEQEVSQVRKTKRKSTSILTTYSSPNVCQSAKFEGNRKLREHKYSSTGANVPQTDGIYESPRKPRKRKSDSVFKYENDPVETKRVKKTIARKIIHERGKQNELYRLPNPGPDDQHGRHSFPRKILSDPADNFEYFSHELARKRRSPSQTIPFSQTNIATALPKTPQKVQRTIISSQSPESLPCSTTRKRNASITPSSIKRIPLKNLSTNVTNRKTWLLAEKDGGLGQRIEIPAQEHLLMPAKADKADLGPGHFIENTQSSTPSVRSISPVSLRNTRPQAATLGEVDISVDESVFDDGLGSPIANDTQFNIDVEASGIYRSYSHSYAEQDESQLPTPRLVGQLSLTAHCLSSSSIMSEPEERQVHEKCSPQRKGIQGPSLQLLERDIQRSSPPQLPPSLSQFSAHPASMPHQSQISTQSVTQGYNLMSSSGRNVQLGQDLIASDPITLKDSSPGQLRISQIPQYHETIQTQLHKNHESDQIPDSEDDEEDYDLNPRSETQYKRTRIHRMIQEVDARVNIEPRNSVDSGEFHINARYHMTEPTCSCPTVQEEDGEMHSQYDHAAVVLCPPKICPEPLQRLPIPGFDNETQSNFTQNGHVTAAYVHKQWESGALPKWYTPQPYQVPGYTRKK